MTPLLVAVLRGLKAVAELLLEKGVVIESIDKFGWTPLSQAAAG